MKNNVFLFCSSLIVLLSIPFYSCGVKGSRPETKTVVAGMQSGTISEASDPLLIDTLVTINTRKYHITIARDEDQADKNALLLIRDIDRNTMLVSDSLFCQAGIFHLEDFNHDGKTDLLIHSYTGGRGANGYGYLYLDKGGYFKPVIGFDTVVSAMADKSGLVISNAFYGEYVNSSFLYFDKNDQLNNTGVSVEVKIDEESARYEKAYAKALRIYKLKMNR